MNTNPQWILIVDDDPEVRTLVKRSIRSFSLDFNCFEANHGLEAIQFHQTLPEHQTISLVVLDLDMPHCNGFELLEYLKENSMTKSVPVCIHSANSTFKDQKVKYHLEKGLSYFDLKHTFSEILSPLTKHHQN